MNGPVFHVGLATDPICADWDTIDKALEYLTRNRRALADTIALVARDSVFPKPTSSARSSLTFP